MTASIDDLRALCDSIAGETEHPPNSNRIFVWAQLVRAKLSSGYLGPYCAAGAYWLLWKLKIVRPKISNPFYCPNWMQWARAHGRLIPASAAVPGDLVLYAFTASAQASKLAEHIETVVTKARAGWKHTFGFNTSSGRTGSQDNGGGCFYRTRPVDATMIAAVRYHDLYEPGAKLVQHKARRNPYAAALRALPRRDLPIGRHTHVPHDAVRGVQWAVGVPVDGVWGDHTDHAVRLFQRYHTSRDGNQLVPDGEVGPLTLEQILTVTHPAHE